MSVTDVAVQAVAKAIAGTGRPLSDEIRVRSEALSHAERFVASVNSARSFGFKGGGAPPLELLRARDVLNVAVVFDAYLRTGEVPELGAPDEAAT